MNHNSIKTNKEFEIKTKVNNNNNNDKEVIMTTQTETQKELLMKTKVNNKTGVKNDTKKSISNKKKFLKL